MAERDCFSLITGAPFDDFSVFLDLEWAKACNILVKHNRHLKTKIMQQKILAFHQMLWLFSQTPKMAAQKQKMEVAVSFASEQFNQNFSKDIDN